MEQILFNIVGSVVEWLEHRDCHRHGFDLKPTRAILLCPWERHLKAVSRAWWSWQAILNFSHISITLLKPNKKITCRQQFLGISGSRSG